MDERLDASIAEESAGSDPVNVEVVPPEVEQSSAEYVGRWNRLVSTTNWEKGRIICEWRESCAHAEAPPSSYSDEAWSRRVGHVSPQHVGRLRRVYQRFVETHEEYPGLYWSHFQAALEWHDAEMWLEGALQNGWSVAQMRTTRWEAVGAPDDEKPKPDDVVVAELDEDVDGVIGQSSAEDSHRPTKTDDEPHPGDALRTELVERLEGAPSEEPDRSGDERAASDPFRPFENLPPLPDDLSRAFKAFEEAILHQQRLGWKQVSREEVVALLEALKQLAAQ
ncbi:MAG: hypothetical protein ACYTG0_33665 [Planctomycetota bacterium]|jgi:hypothetical protein